MVALLPMILMVELHPGRFFSLQELINLLALEPIATLGAVGRGFPSVSKEPPGFQWFEDPWSTLHHGFNAGN